jgi:hypothetical protein
MDLRGRNSLDNATNVFTGVGMLIGAVMAVVSLCHDNSILVSAIIALLCGSGLPLFAFLVIGLSLGFVQIISFTRRLIAETDAWVDRLESRK